MAANPSIVRSVGKIISPIKQGRNHRPWGKRLDSTLEALFDQGIRALKFPPWERDFVFWDKRDWELDFAWPRLLFAVEVEGEVHRIKERFHNAFEKHARALMLGYTVLRVDGRSIRSGEAFNWAEALMWERKGL